MEHDLLDELRLWVHPPFMRRGGPEGLLYCERSPRRLSFVDAKPLKTGDVIVTYRAAHTT